jgi:hypothetical protein
MVDAANQMFQVWDLLCTLFHRRRIEEQQIRFLLSNGGNFSRFLLTTSVKNAILFAIYAIMEFSQQFHRGGRGKRGDSSTWANLGLCLNRSVLMCRPMHFRNHDYYRPASEIDRRPYTDAF